MKNGEHYISPPLDPSEIERLAPKGEAPSLEDLLRIDSSSEEKAVPKVSF